MNKINQPRFKLKLWKNGKLVLGTDSGLLGRFSHLIASVVWDKAYIKVVYLKMFITMAFI